MHKSLIFQIEKIKSKNQICSDSDKLIKRSIYDVFSKVVIKYHYEKYKSSVTRITILQKEKK